MTEGEKPLATWQKILLVVLMLAFVGWAMAGYVSELIGAYR